MELRHLEYFAMICDELHFTRAADKLGISQPTLSHQIKSLEEELGTLLFDRIGKKIALTEAGLVLKSHTAIVFNTLRSAKDQLNELHLGERGTLSIGSLPGELNHLVSSLLVSFNKLYPNVRIRIVAGDRVVDQVLNNELDAAVTILPVDDSRLEVIPLYTEQFCLAVSAGHPAASRASIDFADLQQLSLVMFPQDHKCRQLVDAASSAAAVPLTPGIETNTIDSIFSLIRAGAGAGVLSRSLIQLNQDAVIAAVPIVNPVLSRKIAIVYNRDKFLSHSAKAYISLLQEFARENSLGSPIPNELPSTDPRII